MAISVLASETSQVAALLTLLAAVPVTEWAVAMATGLLVQEAALVASLAMALATGLVVQEAALVSSPAMALATSLSVALDLATGQEVALATGQMEALQTGRTTCSSQKRSVGLVLLEVIQDAA